MTQKWQNKLETAAKELAKTENLKLRSITFDKLKGKQGLCTNTGDIFIQLHKQRAMLEEVRQFHDVRTMSHELAHLKHFHHREEFWAYQRELCEKLGNLLNMTVNGSYSIAGDYN